MEWLSKLLDVHRLPFRVGAWVALASGLLVFGKDPLLNDLRLSGFVDAFGPYIGAVFLASASLVVVNTVTWLADYLGQFVRRWRRRNELPRLLRGLDHAEKAALREFFILGEHTIDLPVTDATIVGLLNKGVVECEATVGRLSMAGPLLPCALTQAARSSLTFEQLDLPAGEPTAQDIARIQRSRPPFAREVQRQRDLMTW